MQEGVANCRVDVTSVAMVGQQSPHQPPPPPCQMNCVTITVVFTKKLFVHDSHPCQKYTRLNTRRSPQAWGRCPVP